MRLSDMLATGYTPVTHRPQTNWPGSQSLEETSPQRAIRRQDLRKNRTKRSNRKPIPVVTNSTLERNPRSVTHYDPWPIQEEEPLNLPGMECIRCRQWFEFKKPHPIAKCIKEMGAWEEPMRLTEKDDDFKRPKVRWNRILVNGIPISYATGAMCSPCRSFLKKTTQRYKTYRGMRRRKLRTEGPRDREQTPGQRAYAGFLNTGYWKRVREAKLSRDGKKCERCGEEERTMHIHHLTYAHRGDELLHLQDLEVLCNKCHIRAHKGLVRTSKKAKKESGKTSRTGNCTTFYN